MTIAAISIVKALLLFGATFIVAICITPVWTHVLYRFKLGKNIRQDNGSTPIFSALHKHKQGTPTMGGVIIWGSVLLMTLGSALLVILFPGYVPKELNFLNRAETLLPFGALLLSAIVGLFDDAVDIFRSEKGKGGLKMRYRLLIYCVIALLSAYWFVWKLDWTLLHIPFWGNVELVPVIALGVFFFVIVATAFSVNETDGLDGLAGGVLLSSFMSYTAIAFLQQRYELATFCAVIAGALLAFLWFNIHPARFFMGDTGSMSLGITLAIVAVYTNTVWVLPIVGCIFVIESASVLIQWTSKALRKGKKIFRSTPIHHHFEALGWEEPKIVMRFWIIAGLGSVFGLIFFLMDRNLLGHLV